MSFSRLTLASLILAIAAGCEGTQKDQAAEDSLATDTAEEAEPVVQDADGDGIIDAHEGTDDPDGDGLGNDVDDDSDGDGIPDSIEAGDDDPMTMPLDTDEDGTPDYLDDDSDGNGVSDSAEAGADPSDPRDLDGDGTPDFQDDDNDGDGILDSWELGDDPSNPVNTDGSGRPDYNDLDSDDDGLCDEWEGGITAFRDEPIDSDGDGVYDFRDTDSDDDGTPDSTEGDVTSECGEPRDSDGDGTFDSADKDADGDGLSDIDERDVYGTDPYDSDSDGDGQTDGAEVAADTDPLDASSSIDGIYVEVAERTTQEENFDFELKIQYGDIAFLIDTTGSMSSTMSTTADRFSEIVSELEDRFENVAYGVAQFDDYNYGSMGSGSDKPLLLVQQITTNESDMQNALNSLTLHSGADTQESTIEAIYQAITGDGYDQNCNGSYDASTDVPPFIEYADDAFGGSHTGVYDSGVEGTGVNGGFGFRDYSLPIIIYATDYYMRDPDSTNPTLASTPGGCPLDAGSSDVVTELADLGGYLIALDVGSSGSSSSYSPYNGMEQLAYDTNSLADLDEDGDADEPLVFHVPQGSASFSEELVENVSTAVEQLVSSVQFEKISLEVEGDEYSMVQSITPDSYDGLDYEGVSDLPFTLEFVGTVAATEEDQFFTMTLNVLGDDTVLLDSLDIVVVVPGTSG